MLTIKHRGTVTRNQKMWGFWSITTTKANLNPSVWALQDSFPLDLTHCYLYHIIVYWGVIICDYTLIMLCVFVYNRAALGTICSVFSSSSFKQLLLCPLIITLNVRPCNCCVYVLSFTLMGGKKENNNQQVCHKNNIEMCVGLMCVVYIWSCLFNKKSCLYTAFSGKNNNNGA